MVAIDGHGAAGKTTIAGEVTGVLAAELIATDSRLRNPPAPSSDRRGLAAYYDWEALRRVSLAPALASGTPLIIVEGVSAASPALADLVTHAVLVVTPEPVRLARLRERISPEEWDETWLAAERDYFASRPPGCFDLVVPGH